MHKYNEGTEKRIDELLRRSSINLPVANALHTLRKTSRIGVDKVVEVLLKHSASTEKLLDKVTQECLPVMEMLPGTSHSLDTLLVVEEAAKAMVASDAVHCGRPGVEEAVLKLQETLGLTEDEGRELRRLHFWEEDGA